MTVLIEPASAVARWDTFLTSAGLKEQNVASAIRRDILSAIVGP